ncbi:MAG TPA: Asp-tRNA(Asn)/Glu-tRNA(Gln) amidotransferase subunit GatC [Firmicutes bacterium]|jgi:aspartyl-tRNA(Asn)/glutamyl-tRNA(Gln) amidotransferase subunit C|nr:Asp-tRNA(Asn)/Glu-tRNA(Gln) amidotransferase subunit GatC [Bacillota bacterium]
MSVSEQELRQVAELVRLAFSEDELRVLVGEFNRILQFVAKLNAVDTTGVPPTVQGVKVKNRFRPDQVRPSLPRTEALKNAVAVKDGSFVVPQIME